MSVDRFQHVQPTLVGAHTNARRAAWSLISLYEAVKLVIVGVSRLHSSGLEVGVFKACLQSLNSV